MKFSIIVNRLVNSFFTRFCWLTSKNALNDSVVWIQKTNFFDARTDRKLIVIRRKLVSRAIQLGCHREPMQVIRFEDEAWPKERLKNSYGPIQRVECAHQIIVRINQMSLWRKTIALCRQLVTPMALCYRMACLWWIHFSPYRMHECADRTNQYFVVCGDKLNRISIVQVKCSFIARSHQLFAVQWKFDRFNAPFRFIYRPSHSQNKRLIFMANNLKINMRFSNLITSMDKVMITKNVLPQKLWNPWNWDINTQIRLKCHYSCTILFPLALNIQIYDSFVFVYVCYFVGWHNRERKRLPIMSHCYYCIVQMSVEVLRRIFLQINWNNSLDAFERFTEYTKRVNASVDVEAFETIFK